jgi:hypothetical protein
MSVNKGIFRGSNMPGIDHMTEYLAKREPAAHRYGEPKDASVRLRAEPINGGDANPPGVAEYLITLERYFADTDLELGWWPIASLVLRSRSNLFGDLPGTESWWLLIPGMDEVKTQGDSK